MSEDKTPYVAHCGFCEQGLLRFRECPACYTVCVICDECELIWEDIAAVSEDPNTESGGAFPQCPSCGSANEMWNQVALEDLQRVGLERFMNDESV
jgi:hypothetical protein